MKRLLLKAIAPVLMLPVLISVVYVHAQRPQVIPQEPREDGGIIHVVQFGDTLEGILEAYKDLEVTMESLQELNDWEFPPQYIFVDQEIIILPPGSITAAASSPPPTRTAPAAEAQ